ncbi:hypothetical protein M1563_01915, partial [Patescibacteria group bacterium]|nr:hypothetical protein [Patescibacteria group bacterium]
KTPTGFILLVIIPATIIVYSELMNIKNETVKLLAERKRRKLNTSEKIEEKIGEELIKLDKQV